MDRSDYAPAGSRVNRRRFQTDPLPEFLFRCIETAVEIDLPDELCFLEQRDLFHRRVTNIVDMGERRLDLLLAFARQSHCKLSKRALTKEFALLTALEAQAVEDVYADIFLNADRDKMAAPSAP